MKVKRFDSEDNNMHRILEYEYDTNSGQVFYTGRIYRFVEQANPSNFEEQKLFLEKARRDGNVVLYSQGLPCAYKLVED